MIMMHGYTNLKFKCVRLQAVDRILLAHRTDSEVLMTRAVKLGSPKQTENILTN
jgi:hypothetical protein